MPLTIPLAGFRWPDPRVWACALSVPWSLCRDCFGLLQGKVLDFKPGSTRVRAEEVMQLSCHKISFKILGIPKDESNFCFRIPSPLTPCHLKKNYDVILSTWGRHVSQRLLWLWSQLWRFVTPHFQNDSYRWLCSVSHPLSSVRMDFQQCFKFNFWVVSVTFVFKEEIF